MKLSKMVQLMGLILIRNEVNEMSKYNIKTKEYRKIMRSIDEKLNNLNILIKEDFRKRLLKYTETYMMLISKTRWKLSDSLKYIRIKTNYDNVNKTLKVEVI